MEILKAVRHIGMHSLVKDAFVACGRNTTNKHLMLGFLQWITFTSSISHDIFQVLNPTHTHHNLQNP